MKLTQLIYSISGIETEPSDPSVLKRPVFAIGLLNAILFLLSCILIALGLMALKLEVYLAIILSLLLGLILFSVLRVTILIWTNSWMSKIASISLLMIFAFTLATFLSILVFKANIYQSYDKALSLRIQATTENLLRSNSDYEDFSAFLRAQDSLNVAVRDSQSRKILMNANAESLAKQIVESQGQLLYFQTFFSLVKSDQVIRSFFIICGFFFLMLQMLPVIIRGQISSLRELSVVEKRSSVRSQIDIFSSIQHELGNKLPALKHDINDLTRFLSRVKTNEVSILDEKVREGLPGENLNEIDSANDIIERIKHKLGYSINVVENSAAIIKSDPSRLQLEKVNLMEYLKNEVPRHIHVPNISVEYSGDESILVNLDKKQFALAIHNLVNNVTRHGFSNGKDAIRIVFELVKQKGTSVLTIKNDGAPFPAGFTIEDFVKPYYYAGISGNSGLGGYLISNVLQNHNATITLNSNVLPGDPFKVQFIIRFNK
jgi:signal transduction histidine kinase